MSNASETIQTVEGVKLETLVSDITPELLQSVYLTGLNFVDADGNPFPSQFWVQHINNAIIAFERLTKIHVLRRTIVGELHDYYVEDYQLFAFIQLFEYPILSVEKVSAIYPTGQFIFEFPLEWVRLTKEHGQIQLVPTQGTLSQVILGRGGSYLPLLYQGMGYLPQLFHIDYTTGFADGKIPQDIIDCIFKLASINVLTVQGDTVFPPGVSNISAGIDGLSQGIGIVNNGQLPPVFAGRINSYRTELFGDPRIEMPGQIKLLKDHYRGLMMRVV